MKNLSILLLSLAMLAYATNTNDLPICVGHEHLERHTNSTGHEYYTCECDDNYITYPEDNNTPCNYKRKEKIVAFLLSFLLGEFGADWFYLSEGDDTYITAGCIKLLLPIIGAIILVCCLGICCEDEEMLTCCSVTVLSFAIIAWWMTDWIRILCDDFPDGNGVYLSDW